jgi:hypothetical protein
MLVRGGSGQRGLAILAGKMPQEKSGNSTAVFVSRRFKTAVVLGAGHHP